tara:strand:+ start:1865 stop:2128 length:264 start_codon:yes stop_codon:yes gene_type:complete
MPMGKGTYGSKVGRPKKTMMKKAAKKKPMSMMVKGADLSGLTPRQQATMKKHAVHHTGKHMKAMTAMMKKGTSFTEAHKMAQKKVGR